MDRTYALEVRHVVPEGEGVVSEVDMGGFASRRRLGAVLVLLSTALAALHAPAEGAPRKAGGQVVELPFQAVALNDHGLVVGNAGPQSDSRAVVWERGRVRELPLPAGATSSLATAVNNRGVVGGSASVPGSGSHAVVWVHGRPRWLSEPPPFEEDDDPVTSYVAAINDDGDAVGGVDIRYGPRVTWWLDVDGRGAPERRSSFRWYPTDINDSGVTIGKGDTLYHAAMWAQPGSQSTELDYLGTRDVIWSGAYSINDAGQIVGSEFSDTDDGNGVKVRSVMWSPEGVPSLVPQPRDGGTASASVINDRGVVVGTYYAPDSSSPEVAVWSGARIRRTGIAGYPVDLNDMGAMLVRDESRSLFVSRWGSRGSRYLAPIAVPRGASSARRGRVAGDRELRLARQLACPTGVPAGICP